MTFTLGTGNINSYTDLYGIHNVVQNTQIVHSKELIIGIIRDFFSEDSYYHYVRDTWGFPLSKNVTDIPVESGIADDTLTRLYIAEKYKHEAIFYPCILVYHGGARSTPLSFNRERETIKNERTIVSDGYGNFTTFTTPSHFVLAGVWEGTINIDIMSRGIRSRDDLVELVKLCLVDIRHDELLRAGVLVQPGVSSGSPSEGDDRNDKLYKQTITVPIRTEWRREIPVKSLVDAINICVDFGNLSTTPPNIAPNLEIRTRIDLIETIQTL